MQLDATSATYLAFGLFSLALIRAVLSVRGYSTANSLENQIYGIIAGCVMFGMGSWLITGAAANLARYNGDPSCRGFGESLRGLCRTVHATITDEIKTTYKSSVTYRLTFRTADGTISEVTLNHDRRGDVWEGAKDYSDRAATVQFFGDDPTLIWTSSGTVETNKFPAFSATLWLLVAGIGLLLVAFDIFLLGRKLSPPAVSIIPPLWTPPDR